MNSHESRLLFILIFYVSLACLKIEANPTKVPSRLFIGRVAYNSPEMVLVSHEPLARYLQKTLNLDKIPSVEELKNLLTFGTQMLVTMQDWHKQ